MVYYNFRIIIYAYEFRLESLTHKVTCFSKYLSPQVTQNNQI